MKLHILDSVGLRERRLSLKTLITALLHWRDRARSRRQLLELDDRMLSDIGLTRCDVLHGKSLFSDIVRE